jgi:hypothetical protein
MAMRTPMEDGDRYSLYNLDQDADGTVDLARERPDVLACFKATFSEEGSLARRLADLSPCLESMGTASAAMPHQGSDRH